MPARNASISPGARRVASNEARAANAAMRCGGSDCAAGCAEDCVGLARICVARAWAVMMSALLSAAPARDDVGFVEEPQAAVPAQHLTGGVEIAAVVEDGGHAGDSDAGR